MMLEKILYLLVGHGSRYTIKHDFATRRGRNSSLA